MTEETILLLIIGSFITTVMGFIAWQFKTSSNKQSSDMADVLSRVRRSETKIELLEAEKVDEKEVRRISTEIIQPLVKNVDEMKDTSKDILHEIHKLSITFAKKFPNL